MFLKEDMTFKKKGQTFLHKRKKKKKAVIEIKGALGYFETIQFTKNGCHIQMRAVKWETPFAKAPLSPTTTSALQAAGDSFVVREGMP